MNTDVCAELLVSTEVFVLSRGSSALYRTLLSISKQDLMPQRVVILHSEGQAEACRNAFLTVQEDDGNPFPNIEYIENRSASIYNDQRVKSETDLKFFLLERDMFLPHHISSAVTNYKVRKFAAIKTSYFQRLRFGNSKVINASKDTSPPISTVVISKNYFPDFIAELNLIDAIVVKSDFISASESNSPSVIIQSNVKSPYSFT